jgi:N-acetylmuramic acid 6-phosphate etherase
MIDRLADAPLRHAKWAASDSAPPGGLATEGKASDREVVPAVQTAGEPDGHGTHGSTFRTQAPMQDRSHLLTEQRLPESTHLDAMSTVDAVALMNAQDARAVEAVGAVGADVAKGVDLVVEALRGGGRLIYVGAGSSGRLGVLDASECPPTFRTDPETIQGVIAGGQQAMFRAIEGAEDDAVAGAAAVDDRQVGANDVVCGIAAGGTTPYVHGALRRAAARGAKTIFLSCVGQFPGEPVVDVAIRPLVGPEVVTGSTRLKAGTATKLVLNALTTLAMVKLGKVYGNLMVDMRASNVKLRDRATRMVSAITGLPRAESMDLVDRADGHVKVAVVMHGRGVGLPEARTLLESAGGSLRAALNGRGAKILKE